LNERIMPLDLPLDKGSPIQAVCIKVHVRICAGGAG
jgi:hypothetical protein